MTFLGMGERVGVSNLRKPELSLNTWERKGFAQSQEKRTNGRLTDYEVRSGVRGPDTRGGSEIKH